MPKTGWRKKVCKRGHDRLDPLNIYEWGGMNYCRACRGDAASDWHSKTLASEKSKGYKARKFGEALKNKYGITLDQYCDMYEKQDFCCAICNNETDLVVDHDHINHKVRGLLCSSCNLLIGQAKESSRTLRNAARYCEAHNVGFKSTN